MSGRIRLMVPTLSHILQLADKLFPFTNTEPWDNSGVQIGDLSRSVTAIAFSLDPSVKAVNFAAENNCDLLVTHHPVLLNPIKRVITSELTGRIILSAAKANVDIISLHTNLDAAQGGLNDFLCELLGLLEVQIPLNATCARLGKLFKSEPVSKLAQMICQKLALDSVRIVGPLDKMVNLVFLVSGSGMGYLEQAILTKADVMITGDVRYHGALDAQSSQISLIDAGHFGLEKFAIKLMRDRFEDEISKLGWNIDLCPYEEENPFTDIRFERLGGTIN